MSETPRGKMDRVRSILTFAIPLASLTYLSGLVVPLAMAGWRGRPKTAYKLDEHGCRRIFKDISKHESNNREEGRKGFPEQPWSAEDHRAAFERDVVRGIAHDYETTLPYAYLCLDEGIRHQWPGPDGKPLSAVVAPLDPRRK